MLSSEIQRVASAAEEELDLSRPSSENAFYSVTLCAIDAVYSISVKYGQVLNLLDRYCRKYDLTQHRERRAPLPPRDRQDAIPHLLQRISRLGAERFAHDVLKNRGRTSPRNGILKAEALKRFAQVLDDHGVHHLQDVPRVISATDLEQSIKKIPGQRSGISLKYFFMNAGSEEFVKPDRMIKRFLDRALARDVRINECQDLLTGAAEKLKVKRPYITPRLLDFRIWTSERKRDTPQASHTKMLATVVPYEVRFHFGTARNDRKADLSKKVTDPFLHKPRRGKL